MNKRIVLRRGDQAPAKPKKRRTSANKVRPKNNTLPDDKDRLNLQMDKDLKAWAQDYAKRHHTSLTQLITDHFVELRREEEGDGVQQI